MEYGKSNDSTGIRIMPFTGNTFRKNDFSNCTKVSNICISVNGCVKLYPSAPSDTHPAMLLEMVESRVLDLAVAIASWSVLWILILKVVPPGAQRRNHIITLNAAHGAVSTIASMTTLYYGLVTTTSVAISLSYFLVDLVAMVCSDGLTNLLSLRLSRVMDYAHHIFGLYWGVVLFVNEATVCDASFGNPYVWLQTNEISTGFFNWYRLTDSTIAGILFIKFFFLSRVAFNTVYILPVVIRRCQPLYVLGCSPFFVLQYVWFYMIARKLLSSLSSKNKKTVGDGHPQLIEKIKKA
ncbi:unnamed protein product [Peronospora effusa]|uniref:TLC domain-containing protein n=1 Tax=Peronospora effusa TaxID=542832 RepID=A0A3R7W2S1_9STRA|nr:hypothetical protein DD237_003684 [Peronospora effusa]CAI5705436.1 unnamed protein product [Peronospora effusa]